MEEVYTNLSRIGRTLEEVASKGKAPLSASQNRPSSTDLGSLEYIEGLRKTRQAVASTSFRKTRDIGTSGINGAGSSTGAKFEYLGRTPYSLGEPSKTSTRRKASGSSPESNLKGKGGGKRKKDPKQIAASSKYADEREGRKGSIGKSKSTTSAKYRQNNVATIDVDDDSSDELNITPSSQPIESPERPSVRSSDRVTGPPGSDSDDCEFQRKTHSSPKGTRASSQSSILRKLKTSKSPPKLRARNDENSFSDGTPEKKKSKIKPRPAYGRGKNGGGSIAGPSGTKKSMPIFTERSQGKGANRATSRRPVQALLDEEKEDEETPRPRKTRNDKRTRKPTPMAEGESLVGAATPNNGKAGVARFPLSKDDASFEVMAPDHPRAKKLKSETTDRDDSGSDDDPLSLDRNDEIINRGGLTPFPMSSQDRPGFSRKSSFDSSTVTGSPKRGSGSDSEQNPAKRRRRSIGLPDIPDIDEYSFTQPADRPDPKTLCPYCDMPFPPNPSPLLLDMLKRIPKYTDVRPTNPLGLTAPLLSYVSMCQRHQFETQLFPTAVAAGWPTCIDFAALPTRVGALRERLSGVLYDKEKSLFWHELKEDIDKKGVRKVMGIAGQFNSFEKSQPGYYGEQGSVIISQTLSHLFPLGSIDANRVAPLTPAEFLQCVLMPECAAALIQEDFGMGTSMEYAIRTLRESSKYGTAMFTDLDNRDGISATEGGGVGQQVGEAMVKERVRARRKEIDEEERVEGELKDLERKENKKSGKSRGLRRNVQSDRSGTDGGESSLRKADTSRKKGKSKLVTRGYRKGGDIIELSDSSSVHTDASIANRTRKRRNEKIAEASDCAVTTMKSESPPLHHQSKLEATTVRPRPRFAARSRANTVDLSSDSEPVTGDPDEATPRPLTRIRTDRHDSDSDIVLPREDNRYEKSTQNKTAKSSLKLKLNGSVQPLQAVKARKTTEEAEFRFTMWENDGSEMEESVGPSSPTPSDAAHHPDSLTRKSSNSWLLSNPSTPSGSFG